MSSYSYDETLIKICFEDFKFTLITETIKLKETDLVSNIGGMLGLFIGCSFVSLFELIELIIEVVLIFSQKIRKTRNVESLQESQNEVNINNSQNDFIKLSLNDHFHRITEKENHLRSSQNIQAIEASNDQIDSLSINNILDRITDIEIHLRYKNEKKTKKLKLYIDIITYVCKI